MSGTCERRLSVIPWASCGIFTARSIISFALHLFLFCALTKSPDLVRHVGICTEILLQRKLWPISFNPRPLSGSQRNAEPRCKITNAPCLQPSYVNKRGSSSGNLAWYEHRTTWHIWGMLVVSACLQQTFFGKGLSCEDAKLPHLRHLSAGQLLFLRTLNPKPQTLNSKP